MNNPNAKDNLKPFKKGEDARRNTDGRPPMPDLRSAISALLNEEQSGMTALDAILKALFKRALAGDVRAAQQLLDRGFGKSTQILQHDIPEGIKVIFESHAGNKDPNS